MSEGQEKLPPCGIYKTLESIGKIPEHRLVYFHNHGNPGPGLYLPEGWHQNRASFSSQGHILENLEDVTHLAPLLPEGFYRATRELVLKDNARIEKETFVQIGYNGEANAILFLPRVGIDGFEIPERGWKLKPGFELALALVKVARQKNDEENFH